MKVKSRWMDGILAEAARNTVKMPFERGARRAALRARLVPQEHVGSKAAAGA